MRRTIFTKLFVSLFSLSILLIVGMSLLVNYSFKTGFQSYLNNIEQGKVVVLGEKLQPYYSDKFGWDELKQHPRIWGDMFRSIGEFALPPLERGAPNQKQEEDLLTPLSHRVALVDNHGSLVFGPRLQGQQENVQFTRLPLMKNGKSIGWLEIEQKNSLSGPLVESFYQQQQKNLYWIVSVAGLFSLFVTALLVRYFLRPLKQLHRGAQSLSAGRYDEKIILGGQDEFTELGNAFNSLALSLKEQKKTREQWISDISHELRTPIAVLRSEIEAIQDGIRQPEAKYIDSMHHQVLRLAKLVDDLYLLSRSDSGILEVVTKNLNLIATIDQVIDNFAYRMEEQGLSLKKYYDPSAEVMLLGDTQTLQQLMVNLLENSLRYTHSPGKVAVSITESSEHVALVVEDSAPSVDIEQLPRLFDRLYRVDQSRSRELGGSGLGLSICQNIVERHQGKIRAYQSDLGGIAIEVLFNKQNNH